MKNRACIQREQLKAEPQWAVIMIIIIVAIDGKSRKCKEVREKRD